MLSNTPLVSIIIPCFNDGKYLQEALDSVRKQSYNHYEVIVINDGSSDPFTLEYLGTITSWAKVIHQPNAGPCVARNKGVESAKGKYLFFLDSDNKVRDRYITKGVAIMESEPKTGVVHSDLQFTGSKTEVKKSGEFNITSLVRANNIDICTVMRKQTFDQAGGFDPYLSKMGLEDWELWFTVYEKGWNFHYIPEPLFEYKVHNISRTNEVANKNLDIIIPYILRKHVTTVLCCYNALYHENKSLRNSTEKRIGKIAMSPFRFAKKILKRK